MSSYSPGVDETASSVQRASAEATPRAGWPPVVPLPWAVLLATLLWGVVACPLLAQPARPTVSTPDSSQAASQPAALARLEGETLPRFEARRRQAQERAAAARSYFEGASELPWQAVFLELADLDLGDPRRLALAQRRLDEDRLERARDRRKAPPPGLDLEDRRRWREAWTATLEAEEAADALRDRFLAAQRAGLEQAPELTAEALAPVFQRFETWALADGEAGEGAWAAGSAPADPVGLRELELPLELASAEGLGGASLDLARRLQQRVIQARRAMAVPGEDSLAAGVREDLSLLETLRQRLAVTDPDTSTRSSSTRSPAVSGLADFVAGRAVDDRLRRVRPLLEPGLGRRVDQARPPFRQLLSEFGERVRSLADEEVRERRQAAEEVRQASKEAEAEARQRSDDDPLARPQVRVAKALQEFAALKEREATRRQEFRDRYQQLDAALRTVNVDLQAGLEGLSLLDFRDRREARRRAWGELDRWVDGARQTLRSHRRDRRVWDREDRSAMGDRLVGLEESLVELERTIEGPQPRRQIAQWLDRTANSRQWLEDQAELRRREEDQITALLLAAKGQRRRVASASGRGWTDRLAETWTEGREEWEVDLPAVAAFRAHAVVDPTGWFQTVQRLQEDSPQLTLALLSLLVLWWLRDHTRDWERSLLGSAVERQRRELRRRGDSRWGRRPLAGDWTDLSPEVGEVMRAFLEGLWVWVVLPWILPDYPFLDVLLWLWLTWIGWRVAPCLVSLVCAPLGEVRPALFKMAGEDQERLQRGFRRLLVSLGVLGTLAALLRDLGMASWADVLFWSHLGASVHPVRLFIELVSPVSFWIFVFVGYVHLLSWGSTLRAAVHRRVPRREGPAPLPWSARQHPSWIARGIQPVVAFFRLLGQEIRAIWRGEREAALPPVGVGGGLPIELRRTVRGATVAKVSRDGEEEKLRQQLRAWGRGRPRSRRLHAVLGDPGMGKGTFLRRVPEALGGVPRELGVEVRPAAWQLSSTLEDPRQALEWLAGRLELDFGELSSGEPEPGIGGGEDLETLERRLETALLDLPPSVLSIDDVQRSVLRTVGGYAALGRLLDVCHATAHHHFWLLAFSQPTWSFLSATTVVPLERFAEPIVLRRLSSEDLCDWLETSLTQCGDPPGSLRLNYESLLWGDEPADQKQQRLEELRKAFWEHLAHRSGGNPQVARYYWLEALEVRDGDPGGESPEVRLNVCWVEPEAHHELDRLGIADLQLLATLYVHDGVDRAHLPRILNRPWADLRERCRRLTSLGVVQCATVQGAAVPGGAGEGGAVRGADPGEGHQPVHYRIHIAWWKGVAEALTRENFVRFEEMDR